MKSFNPFKNEDKQIKMKTVAQKLGCGLLANTETNKRKEP